MPAKTETKKVSTGRKWIRFHECDLVNRKTKVWEVLALDGGHLLGFIQWFGRWRGYSFHPSGLTVFEKTCLRDIADFIEEQNVLHREGLRASKV